MKLRATWDQFIRSSEVCAPSVQPTPARPLPQLFALNRFQRTYMYVIDSAGLTSHLKTHWLPCQVRARSIRPLPAALPQFFALNRFQSTYLYLIQSMELMCGYGDVCLLCPKDPREQFDGPRPSGIVRGTSPICNAVFAIFLFISNLALDVTKQGSLLSLLVAHWIQHPALNHYGECTGNGTQNAWSRIHHDKKHLRPDCARNC